jgi:hypothetical protein
MPKSIGPWVQITSTSHRVSKCHLWKGLEEGDFAGARNRQNLPSGGWPHESYLGRFLAQHWLQMALSGRRLAAKSSWPPPVEDGELRDRGSESRPCRRPTHPALEWAGT